MENKTRTPHRVCGKSLSVMLAAAMFASVGAVSAVSVSALSMSKDEVKNHTVGIIGAFPECDGWTKDIVTMNDDDGDGIYTAEITGQQPGEYEFKVRLDGSWDIAGTKTNWGDYEWKDPNGNDADRTCDSQHNCKVTVANETDVIKVTFDTTRLSEDALAQGGSYAQEITPDDEDAYLFWPVTYEVVAESKEEPKAEYEEQKYGDFGYVVLDDGNVAITNYYGYGYESLAGHYAIVPSEIDGKAVTEINGKYVQKERPTVFDDILNITIPSSVTKIDDRALFRTPVADYRALTIFGEPGSVAEEFAKNKGYNFCKVPADAVTSGNYTYSVLDDGTIEITKYCGIETNINIPSEIDGKKVKQIGDYAFINCVAESVTIPGSIEIIGGWSFQNSKIKKATIENGVKDIGVGAFLGSKELTEVSIPDTAAVSSMAFAYTPWYNNQTDEFVIVGDHTLIKYNGDGGNIKIPDGVKTISSIFTVSDYFDYGHNYFHNYAVTGIEIPNSVEYIWGDAFAGCGNLKEIIIPDSVKEIGGEAFFHCYSLEKVYIPENVTAMDYDDIFIGCENISIYGVKGSTAEKYAKDHDIPFVEWVRNNNNNNSENSNSNNNNNNNSNNNTNNGNNTTNNNNVPATGDNTFAMSAVIAMAVSGAVVLLAKTRKKKAE